MKFKTILLAMVAFITINSTAQTTLVRDKIEAKQSLKLTGKLVNSISTDSTSASKSNVKLITEKAAKNYADSAIKYAPSLGGNNWGLTGNSIITGDYLGTNNAEDLVLKVSGDEIVRFSAGTASDISMNGGAASGGYGVAMSGGTSSGYSSLSAIGGQAIGNYSTAIMDGISKGISSFSIAQGKSNGLLSLAAANGTANGDYSTAIGLQLKAQGFNTFSIGRFNDSTSAASPTAYNALNRAFEVGIGTANNARANAMTVLYNGNVGVGTLYPAYKLDVSGDGNVGGKLNVEDTLSTYGLSIYDAVNAGNGSISMNDGFNVTNSFEASPFLMGTNSFLAFGEPSKYVNLDNSNLTADRYISLPNRNGTVALEATDSLSYAFATNHVWQDGTGKLRKGNRLYESGTTNGQYLNVEIDQGNKKWAIGSRSSGDGGFQWFNLTDNYSPFEVVINDANTAGRAQLLFNTLTATRQYTYPNVTGNVVVTTDASSSLNFPSTSAQSSSDLTITLSGAALGEVVVLGTPNASVLANSNYSAWVSSAGNITVRFNNYGSATQDPATGTFNVRILR